MARKVFITIDADRRQTTQRSGRTQTLAYDLGAGLQVALVSLPLSLGIAVASGAPPITGVISAIIAGLIFHFLGGAYVTISGPAAGLAPALLAGIYCSAAVTWRRAILCCWWRSA